MPFVHGTEPAHPEDGSSRMHGSSWLYEDKAQPSWSDWHEAIGDSLLHLSVRCFLCARGAAAKHYVILRCSSNELQCRSSPCSDLLSHVPHAHTYSARGIHVATHISGTAPSDARGWREKSIPTAVFFVVLAVGHVQVGENTRSRTYILSRSFCVLSGHTPAPQVPTITHMRMRARQALALPARAVL